MRIGKVFLLAAPPDRVNVGVLEQVDHLFLAPGDGFHRRLLEAQSVRKVDKSQLFYPHAPAGDGSVLPLF
ncbi:MAG: hypothetical protein Kow00109_28380 [Acidobacteriota bacterium]